MLSAKSLIRTRICALYFFIFSLVFVVDGSNLWSGKVIQILPHGLETSSNPSLLTRSLLGYDSQRHGDGREGYKFEAQTLPQVSIADQNSLLPNTVKIKPPSSSTPSVFISLRNASLSVKGVDTSFVSNIPTNLKSNGSNKSPREGLSLQESYDALKRKYSVMEFFVYSLCSVLAILTLAFACLFVSSNTSTTSKLLDLWQSHPLFPHSTKEDFNRHVQLQKTLREHCLEQERSSQMESKTMKYLYTPPDFPILCNTLYTEDETPPWFRASTGQARERLQKASFTEEDVGYRLDMERLLRREYVFTNRHNWAVAKVSFYQAIEESAECLRALRNWLCCRMILFSTKYLSLLSPSLATFYFLFQKEVELGQSIPQSNSQSKQVNSRHAHVVKQDVLFGDIEVNASIIENGSDLDGLDDTDDDLESNVSDNVPLVSKSHLSRPQRVNPKSTNLELKETPSPFECFSPLEEIRSKQKQALALPTRLASYYPSFIPFADLPHSITGLHVSSKDLKYLQSVSNNLHIRLFKYLESISFSLLTCLNFLFLFLFKASVFVLSLLYSFLCCFFCCLDDELEFEGRETEKRHSQIVMSASSLLDLGSNMNSLRTPYENDVLQRQHSRHLMERKHDSKSSEDCRTNFTHPSSDHYFISLGNACDRRTSEEKIQAVCTLFSCEVSSYLNIDRFQAMPESFSLTDSQKSARPSHLEKMERAKKLNAHMNGEAL